jgi:hypothetical protein
MSGRYEFEEAGPFLEKLRELVRAGMPPERLTVLTPVPLAEAEEILGERPSPLRFFTLAGGLAGLATGLLFPILTVEHWPLITGGKPLISIPPFIIIAFALTILLGSLASLAGFLWLTRFPSPGRIRAPLEHDNRYVILVAEERSR